LFDQASEIGGQFNMARRIPGKEEFAESLRYFANRLRETGVDVRLGARADAPMLRDAGFDEIVIACGVTPRPAAIPGIDHPSVMSYVDLLLGRREAGKRVAIVGAGGIGFDVAEFLVETPPSPTTDIARWTHEWGIDTTLESRSGLARPAPEPPAREVWLLQRTAGRPGTRLNKTTGWVHRSTLKAKRVAMIGGVEYEHIDDNGFHVRIDGKPQLLPVDNIVICAGQEPNRILYDALVACGLSPQRIGGADIAVELDAKRAIDQGTRLAAML
jgi:2,4-dienoyl-CoA reductase (NADPH2)